MTTQRRWHARRSRVWGTLILLAFLTACAPTARGGASKPVLDQPPRDAPYSREVTATVTTTTDGCTLEGVESGGGTSGFRSPELRGDPDFAPSRLAPDVRCWYEALWAVLLEPSRSEYYTSRANRYDLYTYAREINTHISALLTALRATGDLAILDEVDRLTQHMRAKLEDTWTRGAQREDGSVDGYLNWVWDRESTQYRGRDTHEIDEMRTHALVAQVAYAFEANAGLEGPNGVDYAERAEFWRHYLIDHFEAKWRERHDTPWPEFPFLTRPHMHETVDFIRYHHYLYLLTGEEPYRDEVERLTAIAFGNMVEVPTEAGPALVSPRSVLSLGGSLEYLMPSTYARYLYASAIDLHLQGVDGWASNARMEALARSFSEFVMDNGPRDFARDMGGGVDRGGVPASDADSWSRFSQARYNISSYALLSAWDAGGSIAEVSRVIFDRLNPSQRDIFIPVSLLLDAALN